MLQDRFVKLMLVIIAVLLTLNLLRPGTSVLTSSATAQVSSTVPKPQTVDVNAIKGYQVAGLQSVVALGDGKSFVVSRSDGFMVYQVSDPLAGPPAFTPPAVPNAPKF